MYMVLMVEMKLVMDERVYLQFPVNMKMEKKLQVDIEFIIGY